MKQEKESDLEEEKNGAAIQDTFDGFENPARPVGYQEKATCDLVNALMKDKTINPRALYLAKSMITLARNVDVQNNSSRPREISRNMSQILAFYQELSGLYPAEPDEMLEDMESFICRAED